MTEGFDSEKVTKLFASTGAAFPLVDDPWAALAHGLRLERLELADLLEKLADLGVLAGIRGEPNPTRPGANEALYPSCPDGCIVRWKGALDDGEEILSLYSADKFTFGDSSHRMTKCGFSGEMISGQVTSLLAAETDRTVRVPEEPPEAEPLRNEYTSMVAHFLVPRRLAPRQPFWEWVGEQVGLSPSEAREGARNGVLSRHWRRFSLVYHPSAAGLAGIGMAEWRFPGKKDAQQAAAALASIRGTAEVAVRPGNPDGARVTALFVGKQEGEGEMAARTVATQWGLEMSKWRNFSELRIPDVPLDPV
ncbi:MAG: hypothetical protein JJU11_07295 [Candidatus Sumerlaeia bacterium]|nr:hypothetical protein [Candidatus Sumerlaeia bacterium]